MTSAVVDVHKKVIVACFQNGKGKELKISGTMMQGLLEKANWLKAEEGDMVAMESNAS